MKALSIRQPWVWAIIHGGKRIENRDWYCSYRGPILIHASKWWQPGEASAVMRQIIAPRLREAGLEKQSITLDQLRETRGHLMARATIVDCIRPGGAVPDGQAGWYMGSFGIVLADVRPLVAPVPCKGALSLFEVPEPAEATP